MDAAVVKFNKSYQFFYKKGSDYFSHILESPYEINDDSIFRVLILARPFNDSIINVEGVEVSSELINFFSKSLDAKIRCKSHNEFSYENRKKIFLLEDEINLGFSGGFDSVAAKFILKDRARLLSIDYGGALSREADFFKDFDPIVFKWRLRGKQNNFIKVFNERVDWRFMLSPISCVGEFTRNRVVATGSIMEASPFWFSGKPKNQSASYSSFGFGPGISLLNPVSPLTEYGTTLVALNGLGESLTAKSLKSLASENSLKMYRKKCLMSAALGGTPPDNEGRKHKFGTSLADDFLSLYFMWKYGRKWVISHYATDFEDVNLNIDMSFVEKYNQNNLNVIDKDYADFLKNSYASYGIKEYNDLDIVSHAKVCEALKI
ncbi:hypothetical protein [Comamonas thiooxydans]|uniref:hypothetical protein n=1 Tax=Comamonas thiooxydans TaxID=363952 RepID=UPI000AD7F98C|nr:hypothetical protein [Comamonas thiooxydans]